MARLISIAAFLAVLVASVCAQDFFGGPTGFAASQRDPRQNRGPVTFPVTDPGSQTSGVRVGASGFGFVSPAAQGGFGPHRAGPNPGFAFNPGFSGFYW